MSNNNNLPPFSDSNEMKIDREKTAAIYAARRNAARLLCDAEVAFENSSFGTAQSLSILVMEEIGKSCMYINDLPKEDVKFDPIQTNHRKKQQEFAKILRVHLKIYYLKKKFNDDKEALINLATMFENLDMSGNHPDREILASRRLYDELEAELQRDPIYCVIEKIENGQLDKEKQKGFYIDRDGAQIRSPSSIEKSEAEIYLNAAKFVIKDLLL